MKSFTKTKGSFTSEVHVGLLVLVLILLSLNFLSNYYLFRQRTNLSDQLESKLTMTAIGISRSLATEYQGNMSDSTLMRIQRQFAITGLMIADEPTAAISITSNQIIGKAIPQEYDALFVTACTKLNETSFGTITRGYNNTYLYTCRLKERNHSFLLVLADQNPELAYLEDAGQVLFIVGVVGMLICIGLYFIVYRLFIKPFKVLSAAARKVGRGNDLADDNVDAVIARYQQIIDELQEKEQELHHLHKAAEQRASSVEGFNQYIVGSMQTGLLSCNAQGSVIALNIAGANILEINADQAKGKSIKQIFRLASNEQHNIDGVFSEQQPVTWRETEIITQSSKGKMIGYAASQISDETGATIGYCILFSDITELSKLRLELEQNRRQAALGEMAAGLAHQLRNSLGAIVGYGRLIRRAPGEPALIVQHSETLVDEATQANELITRFLELSHPLTLQEQPVNVEEFVRSVIGSLQMRKEYQRRSITIQCRNAQSATFDPLLMKQVLTNVIENALQASNANAEPVAVIVSGMNNQVTFSIVDSGTGISADVMEKLFTPFFSSRPDGTGLGLAIARRIVELHGGKLTIESSPGSGTTCTITLFQTIHAVSLVQAPAYIS